MRLFRILKLTRHSEAIARFTRAIRQIRAELVVFGGFTGVLLYVASVGIYYFEHGDQPDKYSSIFDALWWAVATLTTVGYGDTYPITIGGRFFTFVILLIGRGVVAVISGMLASALSSTRQHTASDANIAP
jgi:voltage-gated potassium channel